MWYRVVTCKYKFVEVLLQTYIVVQEILSNVICILCTCSVNYTIHSVYSVIRCTLYNVHCTVYYIPTCKYYTIHTAQCVLFACVLLVKETCRSIYVTRTVLNILLMIGKHDLAFNSILISL